MKQESLNLQLGTVLYTVVVSDENGCSAEVEVEIV